MRSFISERAPLSPRMSSEGVFRVGTKRNGVVFDQGRGLVMITWEELRRRACSCDMQVEKEWEFYTSLTQSRSVPGCQAMYSIIPS